MNFEAVYERESLHFDPSAVNDADALRCAQKLAAEARVALT